MTCDPTPQPRFTFPRSRRVTKANDYTSAYAARLRKTRGPVAIFGRPNTLSHPRLGLAIARGAGTAVQRNRIKRLAREAFRLEQHRIPRGLDLIVSVRTPLKGECLELRWWRDTLVDLTAQVEHERQRRERRSAAAAPHGPSIETDPRTTPEGQS